MIGDNTKILKTIYLPGDHVRVNVLPEGRFHTNQWPAQSSNLIRGHPEMPQPGAASGHPLQELNQARQVQPDCSWEASALQHLPVDDIPGVPHSLQLPNTVWAQLRQEKVHRRDMRLKWNETQNEHKNVNQTNL